MPTEEEKTEKLALFVGFVTIASVAALSAGITYLVTSSKYNSAIMKMHITAKDAGVLHTLIDYQAAHGIPKNTRKFRYAK